MRLWSRVVSHEESEKPSVRKLPGTASTTALIGCFPQST